MLRSNGLDRSSPKSQRQKLLANIKEKPAEYGKLTLQRPRPPYTDMFADELIFHMQRLQAIKRPSRQHQNAVYGMVTQNVPGSETNWMRRVDDLTALASGAEHGWFNVFLEKTLNKISRRGLLVRVRVSVCQQPGLKSHRQVTFPPSRIARMLTESSERSFLLIQFHSHRNMVAAVYHKADTLRGTFCTLEQNMKTGSLDVLNLTCPEWLDICLRTILTILAAGLLLVPATILFELEPTDPDQVRRNRWQVLVVFPFTLVFSACCSLFMKARKQEAFTAIAAYSAVLVVVLGNNANAMTNSGSD